MISVSHIHSSSHTHLTQTDNHGHARTRTNRAHTHAHTLEMISASSNSLRVTIQPIRLFIRLLREVRDSGPHFRRRFTLLLRALRSVVGTKLCAAFDHQEVLVSQLAQVAGEVKAARSEANRMVS